MPFETKLLCAILLASVAAGCADGNQKAAMHEGTTARSAEDLALAAPTGSQATTKPVKTAADAAHSQLASPGAQTPAARRYSRTESGFVTGDAVSVQNAGDAITSRQFTKVVRAFEHDLAADPEAQDLTNLYRKAMNEQAEGLGYLTELACGLRVCIGAIRTPDDARYQQWVARFESDRRTPSYSYGEAAMDLGTTGLETRFFFSVDPSVKGVVAPAKPFHPRS